MSTDNASEGLREAVEALAEGWDAADEHGNPLREGSLGEAADELRAAVINAPPLDDRLRNAWADGYSDGVADERDHRDDPKFKTPNPFPARCAEHPATPADLAAANEHAIECERMAVSAIEARILAETELAEAEQRGAEKAGERIAQSIEADCDHPASDQCPGCRGMRRAARIARADATRSHTTTV